MDSPSSDTILVFFSLCFWPDKGESIRNEQKHHAHTEILIEMNETGIHPQVIFCFLINIYLVACKFSLLLTHCLVRILFSMLERTIEIEKEKRNDSLRDWKQWELIYRINVFVLCVRSVDELYHCNFLNRKTQKSQSIASEFRWITADTIR